MQCCLGPAAQPLPPWSGYSAPTVLCGLRSLASLDTEPTMDRESLLRPKARSGFRLFPRTKMYPEPQPWASA